MARIEVHLVDGTESFECSENETFLEAAQENGVATPFGCTSGSCHACLAQVIEGEYAPGDMDTTDAKQKEQKIVLTCQALPRSEKVTLDFRNM